MSDLSSTRPRYFRLDLDFRSNPKIAALTTMGSPGWQGIVMWLDSLAYSTRHLTDGYIPSHWPRSNGYTRPAINKVLQVELWHPAISIDFDGGDPAPPDGWIINDYAAYQTTRANWTEEGRKRHEHSMKAHQARWGDRSNGKQPNT